MDSMNQKCLAYFQEEIRQCKIILDGVLNTDYREFINKKIKYYEYVVALLEKEEPE